MSGAFLDTHAHLSMLPSQEGRIAALFRQGFRGIIDVGTQAEDLPLRLAAFGGFAEVRFSAGIWPSKEAITHRQTLIPCLERHIRAAPPGRLIAVGECGLDRHHNREETGGDLTGERELLELQFDLAQRIGLPIIIHSRKAAMATLEVLSRYPAVRGVIHCFSYGVDEARALLSLGYYLSFAGTLTYKNASPLREALGFVPLDRLLLETDAPYLAPEPFRGKPSEPGMVVETYRLAAALRGIPLETLQEALIENARALWGDGF
ncbi:MAG: TatD family hydrolase [Spirochaetaceae bacterium]|jgi:TatD DNase family protein|nr:TatD family hydrolase [Spirochaetaceae bacterium]